MELRPPPLPDKDFFSVGEASRLAQVPAYTLRYWEAQFGGLRPARRSGGHRRYSRSDMETIFAIKDLLQRRKMTIAGARRALREGIKVLPSGNSPEDGKGLPQATLKVLREVRKEIKGLVEELGRE